MERDLIIEIKKHLNDSKRTTFFIRSHSPEATTQRKYTINLTIITEK